MPLIDWTDALLVNHPVMDDDHAAFVALLNDADSASTTEAFSQAFDALIDHTKAHFAREEALMDEYGFFAKDCHKGEHARVLAEADSVRRRLEAGGEAFARAYVREALPDWFRNHRDTMDFVTARFLSQAAA